MPLNTRQQQTTDKAGAAADGVLPTEKEEPAPEEASTAPGGASGAPAEPGPATEDAEPAPGDTAEPGPAAQDAEPAPGDTAEPEPQRDPAAADRSATGAASAAPARLGLRRLRAWRTRHPVAARALGVAVTVLAGVLVVGSLVMPNRPGDLRIAEFTRLPAEALLGAAVLTALPRRPRLVVAWLGGLVLGALTVLDVLDIGFYQYLGRGFDPVLDWPLFSDAYSYLQDTLGGTGALGALLAAVALVLALLVLTALAVVRLGNLMARHRDTATRTVLVLSLVWMTCTAFGLKASGVPLASERAVTSVMNRGKAIRETLRDERAFAKTAKADTFGATPGSQLVPDLRGKDVIFTFVESYGRSAIEDPVIAPGVDKTLGDSTAALARAGFHAKSGWLTSATYGGGSWLGHSTFLSGLWIDNQSRYRTVTTGDHLSLTRAFKKTGAWDTVGIMPGVQKGWPEADFYGLDTVHNAFQLGYKGPKFSWSTMPDQYALQAFQRLEHGRKRDRPLMSEIILTSSHQPWAPVPKMVGWDRLGDGSVYDAIEKAGNKPADIIADSTRSKQEYGRSIQYSVTSLTQFLERYGKDNTVLVFLGDHQPISRVSGDHASRDVPCAIVAKDPKVLDKIGGWGWSDGLRPAHNAPVWKMSSFRDRFLTAYGSTPHPSK